MWKFFYNVSEIPIERINRTTYILNFEFKTFKDKDNKMEFEVFFYHNRLNNNNKCDKMQLGLSKRSACPTLQQCCKKITPDKKIHSG